MEQGKITLSDAKVMLGVAIFIDLISIIPFANFVTIFIGNATFWLWFRVKGVQYVNRKAVGSLGIGLIIELIPIVSALPALTFQVFLTHLRTGLFPNTPRFIKKLAGVPDDMMSPPPKKSREDDTWQPPAGAVFG